MALNPKVKNPLILSVVSTVFLIPVLILAMFIVENTILWVLLAVTVGIYFAIIFLVFLYYGNIGKK
jgi:Na+-driven multidrug efflux pump